MIANGQQIGRYKILSAIGAGGMGEVYLAEDTELERQVALKVLLAEVAENEDRVRRFVLEAKAASALNHPNILTVYEIGNYEKSRFIATELIKGETLRERLLKGGRFSVREALDVAVQIASALNAAHSAGIIHRDIKPENIMLRDDRLVKVLDFGLAKLSEPLVRVEGLSVDGEASTALKPQLTIPGMIVGTANYMSPEQARGKAVDARSDIFSFGIVLYEMLSGTRAFAGENALDIIGAILHKEPKPINQILPELPAEIGRIVGKVLRKEADERYHTARDLLTDLKDARQELEFQDKLERTAQPLSKNEATLMMPPPTSEVLPTTSGTREIVAEVKKHKSAAIFGLLIFLALIGSGYWFFRSRLTDSPAVAVATNSIAVLPFQNKNNDTELDYLSEGLAESVIDRLSTLPQLKVIARNSSFRYKSENPDFPEIAEEVGVQTIVTGSFTRRGDDLLVRIDLNDARENKQLWGKTYNYKVSGVSKVEEELAQAVSENLQLHLTGEQQKQLVRHDTTNPVAYELMLKARSYARKGGMENRRKAIEFLNQAIVADPNYALAYALLAVRYNSLLNYNVAAVKEVLPKAEAAAQKALELDDQLAEAHYAMAIVKSCSFDWATSEREFLRAIELNPNLARAHGGFAQYLSIRGRHEQGLAEINRAKSLDPLSPIISGNVGRLLYFARRQDEAIDYLKKLLEIEPDFPTAYTYLADAYTVKGMYQEAASFYQQSIKLGEDGTTQQVSLGVVYAKSGKQNEAQAIMKTLQTGDKYVSLVEMSRLYTALGERGKAFETLEKAFLERDVQLQYIGSEPLFDDLRGDTRFQDLLRRLELER